MIWSNEIAGMEYMSKRNYFLLLSFDLINIIGAMIKNPISILTWIKCKIIIAETVKKSFFAMALIVIRQNWKKFKNLPKKL